MLENFVRHQMGRNSKQEKYREKNPKKTILRVNGHLIVQYFFNKVAYKPCFGLIFNRAKLYVDQVMKRVKYRIDYRMS